MNKTRIKVVRSEWYTTYQPQYQVLFWWVSMRSRSNGYLVNDYYSTIKEAELRIREFIIGQVEQALGDARKKVEYIEYP